MKTRTVLAVAAAMMVSLQAAEERVTYSYVPLLKACRLLDTRLPGNKPLKREERRTVDAHAKCGIPKDARMLWVNITLLPQGKPFGFLTVYPEGTEQPEVSLVNSLDGGLRSNAAIVGLSAAAPPPVVSIPNEYKGGAFIVYVTDPAHVIADVSGYFVANDTLVFEGFTVSTPQPGGGKRIAVKTKE